MRALTGETGCGRLEVRLLVLLLGRYDIAPYRTIELRISSIRRMTETILQYLQWAIPGGIGTAIGWLLSSKLRGARVAKEVHDTYKAMYEDVSRELQEIRKENEKIYKAFTRLERAVAKATACRYWPGCPIRSELPDKAGGGEPPRNGGQQGKGPHRIRDTGDGDGKRRRRQRKPADSAGGDEEPPGWRSLHEEDGPDAFKPETPGP